MKLLLALCYAGFALGMFFISARDQHRHHRRHDRRRCRPRLHANDDPLLLLRKNPINEPDPSGPLIEREQNPPRKAAGRSSLLVRKSWLRWGLM